MGRERINVSGWGVGLSPLPTHPEVLPRALPTEPRGPQTCPLQPHLAGLKTEQEKDLPHATQWSVAESEPNLASVPSLPWMKTVRGRGQGKGVGRAQTHPARPRHSPGSAAARSYMSQGSPRSHRPGTRPSGTSPRPGPGGSGCLLACGRHRAPGHSWLCLPPSNPATQPRRGLEGQMHIQPREG